MLYHRSIPVLERGFGFERSLYKLPALFLDDYADLTPFLLRQAYIEALYLADKWEYDRIMRRFYIILYLNR